MKEKNQKSLKKYISAKKANAKAVLTKEKKRVVKAPKEKKPKALEDIKISEDLKTSESYKKMAESFLNKIKNLNIRRQNGMENREKIKKDSKIRRIRKIIFNKKILIPSAILVGVFFFWVFWGIPFPTQLASSQVPVSTKLFDRNGKLIYEIYADKRSSPIKMEELPPYVEKATLSIEDKDFYKHFGISFSGIARAFYKTVTGKRLEGGSTLTQQLIKNTLLTPERTVKRKVREVVLTLVVEAIYSKRQILELYLNQIPYGSTAYGIGAASELYFGKQAKDLTLAEASLLAGLPASPTKYSPFGAHPELAKERQKIVLRRMVEDGHITQEEADNSFQVIS